MAAIGDAHLGRGYLPYTIDGVNRRELDFERSFQAAVDLALAQEPDLIVWLGDIFDHPRPTYRSYRLAQRALATIRDHGVEVVVISGNHDTPRVPGKGSPYSALADTFPDMHFAHRFSYERFDLPGLAVHAVPQMMTVEAALEALDAAAASRVAGVTNLLLTHPRISQLQPRYADINEIEVDAGRLQSDLVLLGHYHTFARVSESMWYAGAPDSFSFADDPDRPKGIVVLDTDTGGCRHLEVPDRRPLVTLETVYALGLSPRSSSSDSRNGHPPHQPARSPASTSSRSIPTSGSSSTTTRFATRQRPGSTSSSNPPTWRQLYLPPYPRSPPSGPSGTAT